MQTKYQLGAAQGVYYCLSRQKKSCAFIGNTSTEVERDKEGLPFDPINQESSRS